MCFSKRIGITVIGGLTMVSLLLSGIRLQIATASPKPQIEEPLSLQIWWPDVFYTENHRDDIDDIFANYNNIDLDIQFYPYVLGDDVRRLSLTKRIAPDALPHLTIIREEELAEAVRNGLVQPIDRWQLEGVLPNLSGMGRVNDIQYGMPYMFQIQHMVYTPAFNSPPIGLDILQAQEGKMLFPALPITNQYVNNQFLAQYLALGGQVRNEDGQPALTRAVLLSLLRFYTDGLERDVFDAGIMNYMSIEDYRQQITDENKNFAFVPSRYYVERRQSGQPTLSITPIPNINGESLVIFDGWVWVLLTDDPDYQDEALRFVQWMTETDRLEKIATASSLLPNRESALRVLQVSPYINFINNLSTDQIFVMPSRPPVNTAAALQQAFIAVISGNSTPEEATTAALEMLGQSE